MGTFDWMELQTLTEEIAAARSRLAAARSTRDMGKARGLEEEIRRAEALRDRLLAHITTNLVTAPEPPKPKQADGAEASTIEPTAPGAAAPEAEPALASADPTASAEPETAAAEAESPPAPANDPVPEEGDTEQHPPETEDRAVATGAAPPAPAPTAASREGGKNVWDQLKPSDIERAKQDLETRRAEMLARHAEELRGLDADQAQLDTLEQAIAAFLQKFNASGGAGVVKLDQERELRQTAG